MKTEILKGIYCPGRGDIEVELRLEDEGKPTEYRGRYRGQKRTVHIDRTYAVIVDGVQIGLVYQTMVTRETRTRGRTYVNSRWRSPGWKKTTADSIWGGYSHVDFPSRKRAVESLVWEVFSA